MQGVQTDAISIGEPNFYEVLSTVMYSSDCGIFYRQHNKLL